MSVVVAKCCASVACLRGPKLGVHVWAPTTPEWSFLVWTATIICNVHVRVTLTWLCPDVHLQCASPTDANGCSNNRVKLYFGECLRPLGSRASGVWRQSQRYLMPELKPVYSSENMKPSQARILKSWLVFDCPWSKFTQSKYLDWLGR